MKKIFTLLLSGIVPVLALAQGPYQTPYASGLGGDADWVKKDVNEDNSTWTDDSPGSYFNNLPYSTIKKYTYSKPNDADDWLIGPAIHLESGKEYKIKYLIHNSYVENLALYMSTGNSIEDLSAGTRLIYFENEKNNNSGKAVKKSATFTVTTTGDYYFGYHCYSEKDKGWIRISGFEVAENIFTPAPPTSLTCTPGEDRALEATLKWTLPTTDSDGAPLAADAVFDAVNIMRDDKLVATLDGAATEWTDSQATGLTSGIHTYKVNVVVNGAASQYVQVVSKYIGPVEAFALPYSLDTKTFTAEDFELFWSTAAGRNTTSTNNWKHAGSSYSGYYMQFSPGSGKVQDNWLISPQMKFTEPGVYRLSVKMSYANYPKADLDILLGSGTTIGGYTQVIKNFTDIPSSDTDFAIYFEVTEPGEYGIAFHAKAQESSYYAYYLKQFAVEKWHTTPAHVTDLNAAVNNDGTVQLTWTNPTMTNTDSELTSLDKVELYCDDNLVETFAQVSPGQAMTYVHTPATSGVFTYHVLPYTAEGAADGSPLKVTTTWVGDETQQLPYSTKFATDDATTPIWRGYDANDDKLTWTITSTGAVIKKPSETSKPDDYLLSPYFDLAPGYYNINVGIKGAGKNFTLGTGLVSDKANPAATYQAAGQIKLPGQSWETTYPLTIKVDEAGKYAVALRANDWMSSSDYDLTVTKFDIKYQPVLPSIATDLTVVPDPDLALSATISWTNPTSTNIEGVAPTLTKAVITRDDVEIATVIQDLIPGETSTFVDSTVPNAGEYVYGVTIYGPEGASADKAPTVTSPWIGAGLNLPWNCADGFRDAGWSIYNVNKDSSSIVGEITWEASNTSLSITSNNNTPDDWAVTPRLNMPAGEYLVTIESYYATGYSAVKWDLYHGSSTDYRSMATKIATIDTANPRASKQTDKFKLVAASPEEIIAHDDIEDELPTVTVPAGVGTIGLHANNKGAFSISAFSIEPYKSSSLNEISTEGTIVTDDSICFGSEAKVVTIHDLSGRTIAVYYNVSSAPLNQLPAGLYIVSAKLDDKTVNIKVAK